MKSSGTMHSTPTRSRSLNLMMAVIGTVKQMIAE